MSGHMRRCKLMIGIVGGAMRLFFGVDANLVAGSVLSGSMVVSCRG